MCIRDSLERRQRKCERRVLRRRQGTHGDPRELPSFGSPSRAGAADGTLLRCPPFLKEARTQIAALQRQREHFEKFSPQWKRFNKATAKTYAKAHRRSENWPDTVPSKSSPATA